MLSDPRSVATEVIEDLMRIEDITATAVLRKDGMMISHQLPRHTNPRRIATMAAAILGTGELAADELDHGRFLRSIIDSDAGKILSIGAGREAILVTLVRKDCDIGLVLIAMEKAGGRLTAILSGKVV